MGDGQDFYLRYYIGHEGKFGHEFLEFEINNEGRLRYSNNSNYKNDTIIRKQAYLSGLIVDVIKGMILDSDLLNEDDSKWPRPDKIGKQELEIHMNGGNSTFITSKIGSLQEIQNCTDPNGLRIFYYLVQDLKCLIFSLISLNFRIKPV